METTVQVKSIRRITAGQPRHMKKPIVEHLRSILDKHVADDFKEIIGAQIGLAKGFEYVKILKDGTSVTIREAPSVEAAKMLFGYVLGEPKRTIEHKGAVGIVHLVAQLEHGDTDTNN